MNGKKVVITGGTGGLGLGVTPAVLKTGANVCIPYMREENKDRLKTKLGADEFSKIKFVKTDLTNEKSVESMYESNGGVDVLLHLAGGFNMGSIDSFSYDDFQKLIAVNLNTAFLASKHALKYMKKSGYGRIVTIGARPALQPPGNMGAYAASKAGLIALTKAIADDTKSEKDVTANVVLTSIIDTPDNRAGMGDANASSWVSPDSLAEAILFLGSPNAKDMRGTLLEVYGKV